MGKCFGGVAAEGILTDVKHVWLNFVQRRGGLGERRTLLELSKDEAKILGVQGRLL